MQISYTKPAQHALKYAAKAAREMKHPYIGTEHLLLALREEYTGVAGTYGDDEYGGRASQ